MGDKIIERGANAPKPPLSWKLSLIVYTNSFMPDTGGSGTVHQQIRPIGTWERAGRSLYISSISCIGVL